MGATSMGSIWTASAVTRTVFTSSRLSMRCPRTRRRQRKGGLPRNRKMPRRSSCRNTCWMTSGRCRKKPWVAGTILAYSAFLAKNQSRFKSEEYNFKKNNSEKHTTASYFAVADLDGNGIPELIIIHPQAFKRVILRFYTYSGGKMVAFRNALEHI